MLNLDMDFNSLNSLAKCQYYCTTITKGNHQVTQAETFINNMQCIDVLPLKRHHIFPNSSPNCL